VRAVGSRPEPLIRAVGQFAKSAAHTEPSAVAPEERILVTYDRRTMPYHAASRIARAEKVAGIIVVSRQLPVSQVINDLEIIVSCSDMIEWENVIKHLPL